MGQAEHRPEASGPERTCAACRKAAPRETLVRWVRDDEGEVFPDLLARAFGRGAWLHPQPDCLQRLVPALSRSFRAPLRTSRDQALLRLRQAAEHRANQLLGSAVRQSAAVFGSDATEQAWLEGRVRLLIVATDGQAALKRAFVQDAVKAGQARAWGSKDQLGALFGRPEVALLGIVDGGLARKLFGAIAMALPVPEPAGGAAEGT